MTTDSRSRSYGTGRSAPGSRVVLLVVSGNMLLDALEVSSALVAMPSVGKGLHLTVTSAQWIVSGFALGFGGSILFGARLVARVGRRRAYLAALLVFALVSLLAGLSNDVQELVVTRFLKGFCAALTAPTGLALIASVFEEGPSRSRAISIYSTFAACGFSFGLVQSGLLTELNWRWTLMFPAPIALGLFLVALRFLPRDLRLDRSSVRPGLDGPGALIATGAAAALVWAMATGPSRGWSNPMTFEALALASLLAAVFFLHECQAADPLVQPRVLARPRFVRSALGAATLNGSYWGFLLIVTFELQRVHRWGPALTGIAILPASASLMMARPLGRWLLARWTPVQLITAGAAAAVSAYALLLPAPSFGRYTWNVLPSMLLVGIGFLLCFSSLHLQATSGLPESERAMVSGSYQTAVQLGGAVVVTVVASLLPRSLATGGKVDAVGPAHFGPAMVLVTLVGLLGFAIAVTGAWAERRRRTSCQPMTT